MIPANYSTISFPSLGIEVNPGRALALGPLTIHYYGLIIAIGLMPPVQSVRYQAGRSAGRCAVGHALCYSLRPGVLLYFLLGGLRREPHFRAVHLERWPCHLRRRSGRSGGDSAAVPHQEDQNRRFAGYGSAGLSHRSVHWPVGQLRQPGSLRRGDGQLLPHGAVQHRHRRMGILPPDVFVRVGVERRGLCAAARFVQAS